MVKNTHGGSKAKGYARKNEKGISSNRLRMVEDESEKYGVVRKIYGGSICEVFCDDQILRQGVIRGKFRGKNRRNNNICGGTLVLVGLREWSSESKTAKVEQCDILEVYSALELDQLKQKPLFPLDFLENSMRDMFGKASIGEKNDGFDFSTIEQKEEIETNENTDIITACSEEINIEDI
jgi:translation initiation factor IF-1